MSFSFTVQARSKAEAKALVAAKLDQVAKAQVCHARDKVQALAVAEAFIDLLEDDPARDVNVSMNGHLAGIWRGSDVVQIRTAAVSIAAGLVERTGG